MMEHVPNWAPTRAGCAVLYISLAGFVLTRRPSDSLSRGLAGACLVTAACADAIEASGKASVHVRPRHETLNVSLAA